MKRTLALNYLSTPAVLERAKSLLKPSPEDSQKKKMLQDVVNWMQITLHLPVPHPGQCEQGQHLVTVLKPPLLLRCWQPPSMVLDPAD